VKSKRLRWAGRVANVKETKILTNFVRKLPEIWSLGGQRGFEGNIKMDLGKVGCEVGWWL
jgi:hypothetical protein